MQPTEKPRSDSRKTVVWLVMAAGIAVPGLLLVAGWYAELTLICFMNCPDNTGAGVPYYRAAAVAGVVLPVIGIGVSFVSRQVAPRVVLGVILAVTLASIGMSNVERTQLREDDTPARCQEHSGGDTTCPGG